MARRMHHRRRRRWGCFPLLALVCLLLTAGVVGKAALFCWEHRSALEFLPRQAAVVHKGYYSPYLLLTRVEDGEVLLAKKSDSPFAPASLTKMMTVLVALENIPNLEEQVEVPPKIFPGLYEQDASLAGFLPGEHPRAVDLIYGALLPSGGEASLALAIHVSGSEEGFVSLMNQKAQALGMDHTHFANVCGLDDPKQTTTAQDLTLLLRAALKNETFYKAFTSSSYLVPPTDLHPEGFAFQSTLFKKLEDPTFPGGEILGGKTGYTQKARLCLASLAEKDGTTYLLITAGAPGDHQTPPYHILDDQTAYASLP